MKRSDNIIIALDGMPSRRALALARRFKDLVWGFKVNDLLFDGIIPGLKRYGRVFADAKLHDIPNTVANSVRRLSLAGADMITVHAAGGVEMMWAATRAKGRSKIIAVTVLTSRRKNDAAFKELLKDARTAGVHGIVCSAHEVPLIRKKDLLVVVPGIRPLGYTVSDDQKRTATPRQALDAGADLLVIGRPITRVRDPEKALRDMMGV